MKERLLSEGYKDIGGCGCAGGARYYTNDNYRGIKINDYYKRGFLTLFVNGRKKETYQYSRGEQIFTDVKKLF